MDSAGWSCIDVRFIVEVAERLRAEDRMPRTERLKSGGEGILIIVGVLNAGSWLTTPYQDRLTLAHASSEGGCSLDARRGPGIVLLPDGEQGIDLIESLAASPPGRILGGSEEHEWRKKDPEQVGAREQGPPALIARCARPSFFVA